MKLDINMSGRVARLIEAAVHKSNDTNDPPTNIHRAIMIPEEFALEAERRPVEHFFDHYMDTPCGELMAHGCFLVRRDYDSGQDDVYTLIVPGARVRGKSAIIALVRSSSFVTGRQLDQLNQSADLCSVFSRCVISMRTARIHLIDSVADAISWNNVVPGSYAVCTGNADSRYIQGREPAPSKIQVFLYNRMPAKYHEAFGSMPVSDIPHDRCFQILDKYVGLGEFNRIMRLKFASCI